MHKYLALSLIATIQTAEAKDFDCLKNPIFCQIKVLNPRVPDSMAVKLSNAINKYSRKFGTDPMVSVAIAMQESGFTNKNRTEAFVAPDGTVKQGITDVGVFQIHVDTIRHFKIDSARLLRDLDYQAYWHTRILKEKIKTCQSKREKLNVKEGNEWSCYHSFTPSKRKIYLNDVKRHLAQIQY